MKKILVSFVTLALLFGMVPASYADNNANGTTVDQSQVQNLVDDGLSTDEAQYLLQLDKKLKNVKNKIMINDQTPDLSDQDVTKNVKDFRKKALDLDPAVLKKGLQAKAIKKGPQDIEKLMEKNPGQDKYRVEYPDGSWVELTSTLDRISLPESSGVVVNGYTEKQIESNYVSDGTWTKTYEMKQLTSTSYAKQFVTLKWKLTGTTATPNGTATATATSLNGGGSSYGTIQYVGGSASYTGSTTSTAKWNSNGTILTPNTDPIQGQFAAVFSCNGSIGLTGVFSLNVNGTWTQYSIVRVWGSGMYRTLAGYYY